MSTKGSPRKNSGLFFTRERKTYPGNTNLKIEMFSLLYFVFVSFRCFLLVCFLLLLFICFFVFYIY